MRNLVILCLIMGSVFLVSCEDFLDDPEPTNGITPNEIIEDQDNVRSLFNGIYRRMRHWRSSGHDSNGYGSILNTRNVKGSDVARSLSSWFIFEYEHRETSSVARKNNTIWNNMYNLIDQTNIIVTGLENLGDTREFPEDIQTALIAEARALRGFFYYNLIVEYAMPYKVGEVERNRPQSGVILRYTPSELSDVPGIRSTIKETYDSILVDLEYAVANIPTSEKDENKVRITNLVAKGILARVYLERGEEDSDVNELLNYLSEKHNITSVSRDANDYANAATLSGEVINESNVALNREAYRDGFNDVNSPEWLWGMPSTDEENLGFAGFGSFWGFYNSGRFERYAPFNFPPSFVALFDEDDDIRANEFEGEAMFDENRFESFEDPTFFTNKFIFLEGFKEDTPLMRIAEMYLIQAEGLARSGQETEAANSLFEVQSNRIRGARRSNDTGEDLINEILLERRKELYGEGLADYPDKRRLGLPLNRGGFHGRNGRLKPQYPERLGQAGDPIEFRCEYVYRIPQGEIDVNPRILQNPYCQPFD